MTDVTTVDVKTAWLSKINWTQALAVLASVLVVFGIDLDAQTQVAVVAVIQGAQAVVTWVFRTWFNSTVPPSAVS